MATISRRNELRLRDYVHEMKLPGWPQNYIQSRRHYNKIMERNYSVGCCIQHISTQAFMSSVMLFWSWRKLDLDLGINDLHDVCNIEINKCDILDVKFLKKSLKKFQRMATEWCVWTGLPAHDRCQFCHKNKGEEEGGDNDCDFHTVVRRSLNWSQIQVIITNCFWK